MKTAAYILGTRVWWRHAFLLSGAQTHTEFIELFSDYASPKSNLGFKPELLNAWERGIHGVSWAAVHRVASRVPGTGHVFLLSDLLKAKSLSAPAAERLMADCLAVDSFGVRRWEFPDNEALRHVGPLREAIPWENSKLLVARCDFNSLLALLCLLRRALAQSGLGSLDDLLRSIFRVLPTVLQFPWVKPDTDLLLQCVEDVLRLRPFAGPFLVDWESLRTQVLEQGGYGSLPCEATARTVASLRQLFDGDLLGRDRHTTRPIPFFPDVVPLEQFVKRPQRPEKAQQTARKIRFFGP